MSSRLYSHLLGSQEDHIFALNTIVTREPMMLYALELLNNLCLKKGVRVSIAFSKPDTEFQKIFEQYFVSLLPLVLRYKLYCGFLPWVIARHPVSGDRIPVLLPIGGFTWKIKHKNHVIETNGKSSQDSENRKRSRTGFNQGLENSNRDGCNVNLEYNCASEYVVMNTSALEVSVNDIHVVNLIDPMLMNNVVGGAKVHESSMGQAQLSPLYVPLQKFLALDIAQQRRQNADDWNCTARLFTTKHPPAVQNERAGRDEIPFGSTRFQQVAKH